MKNKIKLQIIGLVRGHILACILFTVTYYSLCQYWGLEIRLYQREKAFCFGVPKQKAFVINMRFGLNFWT